MIRVVCPICDRTAVRDGRHYVCPACDSPASWPARAVCGRCGASVPESLTALAADADGVRVWCLPCAGVVVTRPAEISVLGCAG